MADRRALVDKQRMEHLSIELAIGLDDQSCATGCEHCPTLSIARKQGHDEREVHLITR